MHQPGHPRTSSRNESQPAALSNARQKLVTLLDAIHFGRVLDLHVRSGQPVFEGPAPKMIRTIKLAGSVQQRPAHRQHVRGREVLDLFDLLDQLGDGVIGRIEIAHGVPLFVEVHESSSTL